MITASGANFKGNIWCEDIWADGTVKCNKVMTEEVIVENITFPDYVFDDSYNLRSLEEVEKFIKSNNHLPDIPSAKQVAEEGMNLKEMNNLLLQKVEELTLYLIEMKKENVELRNDIESIKSNN